MIKTEHETSPRHVCRRGSNSFHSVVASICRRANYTPSKILIQLKTHSSSDFIITTPSDIGNIPPSIVRAVRCHYDLSKMKPFVARPMVHQTSIFKQKSMVFISKRLTEATQKRKDILETMETVQRLYQYLNWTMRISKVAETMQMVVPHRHQGYNRLMKVLLVNTELHDIRGQEIYAVCIPNDVRGAAKVQPWQMAALLSQQDVMTMLDVDIHTLPRGVRASSMQFRELRCIKGDGPEDLTKNLMELKSLIHQRDEMRDSRRYAQLKCINTGVKHRGPIGVVTSKPLTVTLRAFRNVIRSALRNPNVQMIPIVSIVSKKSKNGEVKMGERQESFNVDFVLPVRVKHNFIGVVYRDMECCMVLMDGYDIANKAFLCDPSFDTTEFGWFSNDFNRLKIIKDDLYYKGQSVMQSDKSNANINPNINIQSAMMFHEDLSCNQMVPQPVLKPAVPPRMKARCYSRLRTSMPALTPIPGMKGQQMVLQHQRQQLRRQQFNYENTMQRKLTANGVIGCGMTTTPGMGANGFYDDDTWNGCSMTTTPGMGVRVRTKVVVTAEKPFATPSLPKEVSPPPRGDASKAMDYWLSGL